MLYKVAVMGDYDSICGFAAVGIRIFPVEEEREAGRLLERLSRKITG